MLFLSTGLNLNRKKSPVCAGFFPGQDDKKDDKKDEKEAEPSPPPDKPPCPVAALSAALCATAPSAGTNSEGREAAAGEGSHAPAHPTLVS